MKLLIKLVRKCRFQLYNHNLFCNILPQLYGFVNPLFQIPLIISILSSFSPRVCTSKAAIDIDTIIYHNRETQYILNPILVILFFLHEIRG